MSDKADSRRCPECKSTNIYLESTREIRAMEATPGQSEPPIVAKTLWIRCRQCQASWSISQRVIE